MIYNFRAIGVQLNSVNNFKFDSNVVLHITERTSMIGKIDAWGGVLACTLPRNTDCNNLEITNNIVAGVVWAGYTATTHDCGVYSSRFFYNNVAHGVRY